MEIGTEETCIIEMPSMGTMQIAGSAGFGHNFELIPQACQLQNSSSEAKAESSSQSMPSAAPLPIFLKFEDVEYSVECNSNAAKSCDRGVVSTRENCRHKQILKGITGSISSGEILALMGPSGSGKTTLLKVIGGRLQGNIRGKVTYNDVPYNNALKRRIGFVTQEDVLFPQLTVEETLVFAAFLRLPSSMSRQQKLKKAEFILKELGLERCRNTRIGGAFVKGISGGEKKRTCIGYEILVDPSLLLLDEPTSGLDSSSANKLLQILQDIAKGGRTIIITIHQPSSRVFHMFDKLLLMSEGYPVYYGLAGDAMNYFLSIGFTPQIAMNPADFMLDLATGCVNDIRIPPKLIGSGCSQETQIAVVKCAAKASLSCFDYNEIHVTKFLKKHGLYSHYHQALVLSLLAICFQYLQRKYKNELEPKAKEDNHRSSTAPKQLQVAVQVKKEWTTYWWEQFMVLSKRTYRERCMDYFDLLRLVQAIGVAILLGLLWWKSETGTEAQLRDQVGLLFYICIFWTSSSLFGAVYVFPFEKEYLVRERKADMYRLSVYYICSTLCDMVVHILYPTIFMAILYFMVGFRKTVPCFFFTLLAMLLIVITSQGAGELFGAAVLSIKRAGVIASLVLMLFLLTGGYYVQHIPTFMQWLKYVSFMHYGFRLLLKVQYSGDLLYECATADGCKRLQSSPSFDTIDLDGSTQEVWVLLSMAIAYRLLAYACLLRRISASPV